MIAEFTNGGVASVLDTNTAGVHGGPGTTITDSAMTLTATDVAVSYCLLSGGATISAGGANTIGAQDTTDLGAWEYQTAASGSLTQTFSLSGSVGSVTGAVGSVTGAVGSVTGSVGSVTGNVGGNVTGSVGSVAPGGIASTSFALKAAANLAHLAK